MTLEVAIRLTEILLALALLQQSAEHIVWSPDERWLFLLRGVFSLLLLAGVLSQWVLIALSVHSVFVLLRFRGPYNGGSDRMGLLVMYCLCLAHLMPEGIRQEAAFGYLGLQVILSYFISGQVKLLNPDWRSGQALSDVFRFSAYPVSEQLRQVADRPRLLWVGCWAVMLFEVGFPLSLADRSLLIGVLVVALAFHLANACLFGLNRFVWVWTSAYPSLLWLQGRLVPVI